MKIGQSPLAHVDQWIEFDAGQRRALESAYECCAHSPEAQALLERDIAELAKPDGAAEILAQAAEIESCFGQLADVYPVLVLLARVPALYERYRAQGIDIKTFTDTLGDIPLWMANFRRKTGREGIAEYEWLSHFLRFVTFRLGRLEYIYCPSYVPAYVYRHIETEEICCLMQAGMHVTQDGELAREGEESFITDLEENALEIRGYEALPTGTIAKERRTLPLAEWVCKLQPEDPVLDVHIPEGPPMDQGEIRASLACAPMFFKEKLGKTGMRAFTCGSWLMSLALPQIIPGSRLAAFQHLFRCVPYTVRDTQVFERVFGKRLDRWEDMPCENSLQRGVRDWYLQGRHCRQMQGIILLDQAD